ncbi:signal recognition particle protein [Thermanaerovibrio velox DSM 12556]|uniref:Signal recognition particle protein n=1 Tax=Thermanaerovibrio velox DSM 12556 TaxID=926567 RepID=H0UP84_9BACT|nr:signal recognition particle protein [Thermanaerovibrio velox]EHM09497.1 signal recognition particle protein [Thermanaerovibrio velox DSM 12556]
MFDSLKDRFEKVFSSLRGKGKLTEEDVNLALREVRLALLEADVNYKVVKDFVERVRARATGQDVLSSITPAQQVYAIVFGELLDLMGRDVKPLSISPKPPTVYMMVGLQGSGKTTTAAKIALKMKRSHKPMLVACDLRRPAAVEQLRVLASSIGVPFVGPEEGEIDPVRVARRAMERCSESLVDLVIIDTAGRFQIDEELMEEVRVLKESVKPHEVLLVVDSMTGQEAVSVAQVFNERLGLTGVVLTKLDGDARGGAALTIKAVTGTPVRLAGVGEKVEDLEAFDPNRMAQRILGMGDVVGLLERVQQAASEEDVERLSESLKKNRFTLEDMLIQLRQVQKMGPLEKVIEMLPVPGASKALKDAQVDPKRIKHMEAIILSMTPAERRRPEIIKGSRRRRIAQGSGTSVQMVNQLLHQYEQMKDLMKAFGKGSRKGFRIPQGLKGLFR